MKILCFGDSNTYGYDPRGYFGGRYDPENRWPELLARQTGWEVINEGSNGRCIPDSSRPFSGIGYIPDRILVMLGTNDLLQGLSPGDAAARMEAFLIRLSQTHPEILLIAPPPLKPGEWVCEEGLVSRSIRLAEEYKQLAQKLRIPFIDTRGWHIPLAYDGVHFTEQGHSLFAKQLQEALYERI